MAYETLIKEVEECSEEEIRKVTEKTDKTVLEIREEAEEKVAMVKEQHQENIKKLLEIERIKLLYDARAENKIRIISEKRKIFQTAFLEAQKDLAEIRDTDGYNALFNKLVHEAFHDLKEEQPKLHIDQRDEELCREISAGLSGNCEIISDLDCAGGLNISTADGKIIVFNTIESRLDNARGVLKLEIFSTLYGD